jgi:hypothetical protein
MDDRDDRRVEGEGQQHEPDNVVLVDGVRPGNEGPREGKQKDELVERTVAPPKTTLHQEGG